VSVEKWQIDLIYWHSQAFQKLIETGQLKIWTNGNSVNIGVQWVQMQPGGLNTEEIVTVELYFFLGRNAA